MDQSQDRAGPGHDDRAAGRAELLPEEEAAGSDNARAQAEAILAESDQRSADRDGDTGDVVEHRTSDEATEPS